MWKNTSQPQQPSISSSSGHLTGQMLLWDGIPFLNQDFMSNNVCVCHSVTNSNPKLIPRVQWGWALDFWQAIPSSLFLNKSCSTRASVVILEDSVQSLMSQMSLISPILCNLAFNLEIVLGLTANNAVTWFCGTPACWCAITRALYRSVKHGMPILGADTYWP